MQKECNDEQGCSDSTSSAGSVETTLTHEWGFGFSLDAPDTANWQNNDGDVTVWQPGGGANPSYSDVTYVWWRTFGSVNETRDMGDVSLSSVKSIPTTWDVSPNIPPLLPGHVVVARCRDGYAKYEVVSTDTMAWSAEVKYVYTSGASFE